MHPEKIRRVGTQAPNSHTRRARGCCVTGDTLPGVIKRSYNSFCSLLQEGIRQCRVKAFWFHFHNNFIFAWEELLILCESPRLKHELMRTGETLAAWWKLVESSWQRGWNHFGNCHLLSSPTNHCTLHPCFSHFPAWPMCTTTHMSQTTRRVFIGLILYLFCLCFSYSARSSKNNKAMCCGS